MLPLRYEHTQYSTYVITNRFILPRLITDLFIFENVNNVLTNRIKLKRTQKQLKQLKPKTEHAAMFD